MPTSDVGEGGEEEQAMRAGNLKWKIVLQKREIFGREEWDRQKLHLFLLYFPML